MIARQSVKVWTWRRMLRDHGPRKPGLLLTLHTIGTWMDGDGYCHPSQKSIAKGARITERTVRRHVDEAVALGWLHTELGPAGGRGWRRTAYHATAPRDVDLPDTDADQELTDALHSQCGDVGEEYSEGEDTIMSARSAKGEDSIVSARYEHADDGTLVGHDEIVRTSDARRADIPRRRADTGDRDVRTQPCPTNSPVNSPVVELSKTEGAAEAARLSVESESLAMTASRKNGMQHISGATRDRREPVLQARPSAKPIGSAAYKRDASITPADISAVLNGEST